MIAKLLVANRGEIAARVLRTARAMGIATVAVFSDPDRDAPFVALADEAVPLGGTAPAESYLRIEAILDAAEATGADAVHPGYGFLAESAELAAGCRKRGLSFVGPPPEVLAVLGDKLEAKRIAAAAGVPVLPGTELAGPADDLIAAGELVGFPLAVKATFGGGGIGMAVVRDPGDLPAAVEAARRQAGGAFGNDAVFLERWLEAPRHVEVQVLADTGGRTVHLFERECSIQRRHQKLVEEAPSPAVGPGLRDRLGEAALAVARAVGYVGAGTVEFLLAEDQLWFLEVNARIQVEHPVTEAITGLDLVRLQLLVAAGQPLPPEAPDAEVRGHAVEARLYAEDPAAGFRPQAGVLHRFRVGPPPGEGLVPGAEGIPGTPGIPGEAGGFPGGRGLPDRWGVRVDAGVADGSDVGVHYDPLLAKVVAHAPTRPEAAGLLAATLAAARLHGIVTNRDLLVGILRSEPFLSGETDTGFLDRHPPSTLAPRDPDPATVRLHAAAAALAAQAERRATARVYPTIPSGWRNNPSQLQQTTLEPAPGETLTVAYRFDRTGTLETLEVDGDPLPDPRLWRCIPDPAASRTWLVDLEVASVRRRFETHRVADTWFVDSPLGHTQLRDRPGSAASPSVAGPPVGAALVSPLPGVVRRVAVGAGDRVEAGTVVVVVEAMKTEHRISAPRAGRVERVLVVEGQEVAAGVAVVALEEAGDG